MRFLADENFPGAAVTVLGAAGHDVAWVGAVVAGASDPDVLAWAAREERILLTFDKDFGELAKGSALPPGCGVILLRMPMPRPGDAGRRLADLITAREDWAGNFSVIEPGRVRMRPPGRPAPEGRTDWERVRAMTDEEVVAAAVSDPDAQPITPEQLARMRRLPDVKALRARLGMTQEQFACTYCLPLGTVRDWEQGRTRPDAPALALLAVIDREPEIVRRALH